MKKIFEKISSASNALLFIPLILTIAGFALNFNSGSKSSALSEIKYGVNLCFTRLTQSVIALQSHDYFSKHLERSYVDFTNECFFEFKEKVAESFSSIEANKLVDQLLDEAQVFSKSLINVLGKRQTEITRAIVQEQILPAYSKVDFSRFNLNQWIKQQETSGSFLHWQSLIFIFILIGINALLIILFWSFNQQNKKTQQLELKAEALINDTDYQPHRMEVFLAEILDKYSLNKSLEVLKKYSETLINQSQILAKMKEIKETNLQTVQSKTIPLITNTSTMATTMSSHDNSSLNAAAIALESDEWQTKDIGHTSIDKNVMPPMFRHEDKFFENSNEIIAQSKKIDEASDWTDEDESENVLNESSFTFSPVTEPISDLSSVIEVAAKNLGKNNSNTAIIHDATQAPFWLKGDHEHYEQLFIALVNKVELRFKEFATPAELCCLNIDYDVDMILNQATIIFSAKKAMFHIDDLEYFHDHDHLTVDTYNVIIKEMVKELYAEISFKNLLGENLDDNSLSITLKVPVRIREVEKGSAKLIQLVKGKKKNIQKNRNKEITI